MADIKSTLKSREKTHGNFGVQSSVSQNLKLVMHNCKNWDSLSCNRKESLEMIAVKISRILNGDPNHIDSWHDICGYAALIAEDVE